MGNFERFGKCFQSSLGSESALSTYDRTLRNKRRRRAKNPNPTAEVCSLRVWMSSMDGIEIEINLFDLSEIISENKKRERTTQLDSINS